MINPHRIKFNNFYSFDFDLITDVAFESDDGETNTSLNREIIASESYNGRHRRMYGSKYNDVFSPKFTFTKNDFSDFSEEELRRVLSWLTSKSTPSFLTVFYDDSEVIWFECLGGWQEISVYKLANDRVVSIVATFESSAPYAFSPIQTVEKDIKAPQEFIITCNSDELDTLLYPKVTITQGDDLVVRTDEAMGVANKSEHISGTVYLYNNTYYWVDNKGDLYEQPSNTSGFDTTGVLIENITANSKTTVGGNISQEIVTLDGANRVVASNRENRIFGNDFNWQWMPLVPGENTITVTGSCTIKFEWREPRKVGF